MMKLRISSLAILATLFMIGLCQPQSNTPNLTQRFERPQLSFWMGTDQLGRDVFCRGTSAMVRSVLSATSAWLLALVIGTVVGTVAAINERSILGRTIESLISIAYTTPLLLLLVGAMSLIGRGSFSAYLIVSMVAWAPVARHARVIVRETLRARFVTSAIEMGFDWKGLTFYVLIPTAYRSVLIASLPLLPELIAIDASLSFFGFGPAPPTPTVGGMIVNGINHFGHAPWLFAWPVGLLMVVCLLVRFSVQKGRA